MRTLASLGSPISSLVVSRDGSTLITAQDDGVGFLDLASGERHVRPVGEGVRRLAWGPDGLLAGTSSGEIWTVGARLERLVEAFDDEISGLAAAHTGTIAVCGGEPFAVATFGRYGNEEWRGEPFKWPYCVRLSGDGKRLALATWSGHLFVFDTADLPDDIGDAEVEYAGGPIFDAQFLPGDDVVVAGARFVRVWDRAAGRYARTRELPAEAFAIAVAPDASCAVASTNDQRLRVFRLPDLEAIGQLATGDDDAELGSGFPDYAEYCRVKGGATVRVLAFHPDGTRVFAGTEDGQLLEVSRAELELPAAPRASAAPAASRAPTAYAADAPAADEVAADEVAADEVAADEVAADEVAADEVAAAEPAVTRPSGSQRAAKKPADGARTTRSARLSATKPARNGRRADKPPVSRPSANRPSANRPSANRPSANRPSANRPSANKPAKPASTRKAATKQLATRVAGSRRASKKSQARR